MKSLLRAVPALSCLVLPAVAPAAILVTPEQSLPFFGFSGDVYHTLGDGTGYGYEEVALNGFTQFDPALGTLLEIHVSIELGGALTYGFDVLAYGDDAPPDGTTFDAFFEPVSSVFEAGVIYSPSGESFGLTATSGAFDLPTLGVLDEPVDDHIRTDEGRYLVYNEYFADEAFGPINPTGILDTGDAEVKAGDFVGAGNVSTLVGFLYFQIEDSDFIVNNLPYYSTSLYASSELFSGVATLQYVYDDGLAAIPEPRMLGLLLGLVTLGAALRRRR